MARPGATSSTATNKTLRASTFTIYKSDAPADTREDSNLEITSSSPVGLTMTTANPAPTSTITWETSSTGAMTFTSNATDVATVSNEGVITAVGPGTATITISQAADDDYKASGDLTVTVNVTDSRDAVATGIDLSSAKTILKDAKGSITATGTKADGFDGDITYAFETANASVFSIAEGIYTGAGVGATTVTITATPTGGSNANAYKAASQVVDVTVNGTNSISLDKTSHSVAYGAAAFTISATIPTENYNGTVTAVSSNTNVATVTNVGTTVTVTPVAVGSATITVTAGAGTYYPSPATATCSVTVTAPTGKTEAPSSSEVVFNEQFSKTSLTGGHDGEYSGSVSSTTLASGTHTDESWTKTEYAYANNYCSKVGKTSASGTLTSASIKVNATTATLTFSAAGWENSNKTFTGTVTITNGKFDNNTTSYEFTPTQGSFDNFEVGINSITDDITISFGGYCYFLDDVKVTKAGTDPTATVELNKYGYGTYCSEYPIDFSNTTGYTAWRVSNVASNGTITFTQITEKIKGGQGVLLYNKDADGVNKSNVTVNFADGTKEFTSVENKLVGTMALTNVAENQYYGLSGESFLKVNPGNVPAGKALLPASEVSGARQLTFIFEDTQGISAVEHTTLTTDDAIYSISGQRVSTPKKGLYIMNGKKVLVK